MFLLAVDPLDLLPELPPPRGEPGPPQRPAQVRARKWNVLPGKQGFNPDERSRDRDLSAVVPAPACLTLTLSALDTLSVLFL